MNITMQPFLHCGVQMKLDSDRVLELDADVYPSMVTPTLSPSFLRRSHIELFATI